MNETDSLKIKTISALLYSFGGFVANSGIQFVIGIIMARLLLPKDYGVLGMVAIFIAISKIFIDSGMTQALIREKEVDQADYSTVFYYNLLIAIVMYVLLFLSAKTISIFFREPLLVDIVRVVGLGLIISSLGLIQRTMLIRKLDFKTQTKIDFISCIMSGCIGIIFAYIGYGVWSLVIGSLSNQVISSFLLMASNKWLPSVTFNINSFKRFFGFGWKLLLNGLLVTMYRNVYNVIIGRMYSATQLGYYTKSVQLSELAVSSIGTPLLQVSYPVLSKMKDNDEVLKAGFKKIIKNVSFLTFPIMIGLAAVAGSLIQIMFGDNWVPMVPYFQIICLTQILTPHYALNLNILLVKGRSDLVLRLHILIMCIGLIGIGVVLALNLGIYGLLWMGVSVSPVVFFIASHYSKEFISYSTKEQIRDMIPTVIISIVMGILVYISGLVLPFNNGVKLSLQVVIGVITYTAMCKLARIEELDTVYQLTKKILQKSNIKIMTK